MICEKCGGKTDSDKKCFLCGYDNSNVVISQKSQEYEGNLGHYRGVRLTIFLWWVIVFDIIAILMAVTQLFKVDVPALVATLFYITIAIGIIEMILCIFMFRLKKWALYGYVGLAVVSAILQLMTLDIFGIIFKALLLYFVFRKDWDSFE